MGRPGAWESEELENRIRAYAWQQDPVCTCGKSPGRTVQSTDRPASGNPPPTVTRSGDMLCSHCEPDASLTAGQVPPELF